MLDAVAVAAEGSLNLFVLNRNIHEDLEVSCDLRSFGEICCVEQVALEGYGFKEENSAMDENHVIPVEKSTDVVKDGYLQVVLHKASWSMFRFEVK